MSRLCRLRDRKVVEDVTTGDGGGGGGPSMGEFASLSFVRACSLVHFDDAYEEFRMSEVCFP